MSFALILGMFLIQTACQGSSLENNSPAGNREVIKSEKLSFTLDTVATGLEVPWGMAFLPNGDLLISERKGELLRLSKGTLTQITGLPDILAIGQGGLLDLQLHPDYAENNWVYFAYAKPIDSNPNSGNTAIMRARLSGNALTNKELLFEGLPATSGTVHFGSRMVFDNDGYLWFGIGDRGNRDVYPQTLDNHAGKIMRIHDDGQIPDDNPFVDSLGTLPEIYSYGHRNPQGIDLHPQTGQIWMTEHGPRGGDEINLIGKGLNYGWPVISYGINYNGTKFTELTEKEGMEQPQLYWDPSIAPCGTVFVTGDRYPAWKHNLLIGSLKFRYLERVELDGNTPVAQEKLLEGIGRVRHVAMGSDGYIYVAAEKPGFIVRIVPVQD